MPSSSSFLTSVASEKRGGWLGEMLVGGHVVDHRRLALRQPGQALAVVVLVAGRRGLVAGLGIDREEAREDHDLARRAQPGAAVVAEQVDAGALHPRARHLAGDRALPDQLVQLRRIGGPGMALRWLGGPDRLVRFLRVLGLGRIVTGLRRQRLRAELPGDRVADDRDGLGADLHAVGPHVGDVALFVESLRDAHRMAGGEAELARRLLLQAWRW